MQMGRNFRKQKGSEVKVVKRVGRWKESAGRGVLVLLAPFTLGSLFTSLWLGNFRPYKDFTLQTLYSNEHPLTVLIFTSPRTLLILSCLSPSPMSMTAGHDSSWIGGRSVLFMCPSWLILPTGKPRATTRKWKAGNVVLVSFIIQTSLTQFTTNTNSAF